MGQFHTSFFSGFCHGQMNKLDALKDECMREITMSLCDLSVEVSRRVFFFCKNTVPKIT